MNTKTFGLALGATLLALCGLGEAQEPKKIPQIGYQTGGSASAATPRIEGFRQGLRELGYTEGAKPADLPVEGPKKFEMVINLKTAQQIGLNVSEQMLKRADKVINGPHKVMK